MALGTLFGAAPNGKLCKNCRIIKDNSEFYIEIRNKDGLGGKCKLCCALYRAVYNAKNKIKVDLYKQVWRERNPERDAASRAVAALRATEKRREESRTKRIESGLPLVILHIDRYEDGKRICTACRKRKNAEDFGKGNCFDGKHAYCRECQAKRQLAKQKAETAEQREKRRIYSRKFDVKRNYGVDLSYLRQILLSQNGKCAICETAVDLLAKRELNGGAVDHDHATGRVRAILCIKCNAGLGQFRDNEDYLLAAVSYLRHHRGS